MCYTIYDLAKECQVSVATVSRVINNSGPVKEKTRQKILKLIKEKNYSPNAFARGLNNISMKTIGIIISDIGNPFFAQIVKSIDSICQKNQYSIILCSTENNSKTERREIEMLMQKQVEGFIIAGSRPVKDENASFLTEVSKKYPIVLINSFIRGGHKMYSVMVDEKKSTYDALSLIISKGHKKIFLLGDTQWKTTVAKINALKDVLKDNGLSFDKEQIINCKYSYSSGMAGVKELLSRNIPFPYTIFCSSDMIAIGAMKELLSHGIKIPEEIAIMGYSNTENSSLTTPSLSTVDQKMHVLGEKAAKIFIDILDDNYPMNKKMYSEYKILMREST